MKRLVVLICVLATFSLSAQEGARGKRSGQGPGMMKDLTAEEAATLKTKKMTLGLDLTEAQQDKIYQINLKNAQDRKARMEEFKKKREAGELSKPTKYEILKKVNERLDNQIAHKKEMKSILNQDQYEKWQRNAQRRGHKKKSTRKQRFKRSRR